MPLALPYAGQPAAASARDSKPIRDNFQAIADYFNGNLVNADISPSANIDGSKLLDASVPAAKMVPASITVAQLANDAVETLKIKDLNVTTAKLALLAVGNAQMAVGAAAANLGGGTIGNDKLKVTIHNVTFSIGVVSGVGAAAANPSIAFAKATYDLLGVFVKTQTGGSAAAVIVGVADDSGTNWAGRVRIQDGTATETVAGTLTFVFISKT